jgi:CDP-glucose 4,6-dehydratase
MINPDAGFWYGRNVFVTGHTGFKGSWLSAWLLGLGACVTGYSLEAPTRPSMFKLLSLGQRMNSIAGDVRDADRLVASLRDARPSVIFHLAAQPLVRRSYADAVATYAVNVMGTVHLLEAARSLDGLEAVVVITSDKCYADRGDKRPHAEDDAMGGHDPYSSSKGCAELVAGAYQSSFFAKGGPHMATARAGNVIGGGDWADDRLVPDAVRAVSQGQALRIRHPGAIRPWQHVLEPLCGYLVLAEKLCADGERFCGGWNFGPLARDARSVDWIVSSLQSLWGGRFAWTVEGGDHPHESTFLTLDTSKAQRLLGLVPRTDLSIALQWVVEWYDAFMLGGDLQRLTERQIGAFVATHDMTLDELSA